VGELTARLCEVEAEREALRITAKTIPAMAASLDLEQPPPPVLLDGAAYIAVSKGHRFRAGPIDHSLQHPQH
jgi:hypothetical protein